MKNKEIQSLPEADLKSKIKEEKDALSKLKINHGVSPLENPILLRANRRNIARLLTEESKRKASNK
jgi:large subunit ribosomal protein L29